MELHSYCTCHVRLEGLAMFGMMEKTGKGSRSKTVSRRVAVLVALLGLGSAASSWAATEPTGGLAVLQRDQQGKPVVQAQLDAAQLAALPRHVIRTITQWTDGVKTFEGPLVSDVLKAAGVKLDARMKVHARALNGYTVDIPAQDFLRWPVILAYSMDGRALTRRDKGPLWIVYPRDSDKTLHDAKYDHRWAWQLDQLTVLDSP